MLKGVEVKESFLSYKKKKGMPKSFVGAIRHCCFIPNFLCNRIRNKSLTDKGHSILWQVICGTAILGVNVYLIKKKVNFVKYACVLHT